MTRDEIREALAIVVIDLGFAINNIKREHEEPFRLRDPSGRYVLLDALAAEATALGALAALENA